MKPPTPIQHVQIVERMDLDDGGPRGFLTLARLTLVNHYQDGSKSPPYVYDAVLRKWLDAVVLVLSANIDGVLSICLRRCIRPPLVLREELKLPVPDERPSCTLWEVPAGLLEEDDVGIAGIKNRAAIEALEETGYTVAAGDFSLLPGAPFLSPGVIPERLHFAHARIADVHGRKNPTGDGSPVEDGAIVKWFALGDALRMCDQGVIADTKTELALRRLADRGQRGKQR